MIHCTKCGRTLDDKDKFCPGCGEKVTGKHKESGAAKGQYSHQRQSAQYGQTSPKSPDAAPNQVQYVYVNKKTGKITQNPGVKTSSEGCIQYVGVAFAAVALVIVMAACSVILSGYLSENSGIVSDEDRYYGEASEIENVPEVVSSEISSEPVSSEPVSSEPVSSEPVSSEPAISEELTAKYMQKKIKGKWRTDVPYKNMSLPGTFEFDGKGNCQCTIKAFLFSKKFEGDYTIKDGGECRLTLKGLEEYFDDDTMIGNLRFVTDDKMEFTVSDTVWKLNRVE